MELRYKQAMGGRARAGVGSFWAGGLACSVGLLWLPLACGEASSNAAGASGASGASASAAGAATGGGGSISGGSGSSAGNGNGNAAGASGMAGGAPVAPGAHCEPALSAPDKPCSIGGDKSDLPNPVDVFVREVAIQTPMVAGERYAISLQTSSRGVEANIELWGTDTECGIADELLWFGPAQDTITCAEFVAPKAYPHVLSVIRPLRASSNFSVTTQVFKGCAAGTCPAGPIGTGRTDKPLQAPTGAYEFGTNSYHHGPSGAIGGTGYFTALRDVITGDNFTMSQGLFRMPHRDPYGDAWYCFGPGSTWTQLNEDEAQLDLKGITRLGSCEAATGTGTASIQTSGGFTTAITASLPQLPTNPSISSSGGCRLRSCNFQYNPSPIFTHLGLELDADVTSGFDPLPDVTANVLLSQWTTLDSTAKRMGLVCGKGGTIQYGDTEAPTTIDLQGLSYLQCPGAEAAGDSLTLIVY